jgi:hypothetical protein
LAVDDWIYITEDTGTCMELVPVLFSNKNQAHQYANAWRIPGRKRTVEIVKYDR